MPSLATDGSSLRDARPTVEIDPHNARDRWRFKCPNNHTTWEPTNGGLWCQSCSNAGLDPHYHKLYDSKRGVFVRWSDVVLVA